MPKSKVILLGVLAHIPAAVMVYYFGLVLFAMVVVAGSEPPRPAPVLRSGDLLLIGIAAFLLFVLPRVFSSLPVVEEHERGIVHGKLILFGVFALPRFWYTRVLKQHE